MATTSDIQAAQVLGRVLPKSPWAVAATAGALLLWLDGVEDEHVAQALYDTKVKNSRLMTLTAARDVVRAFPTKGFLGQMERRKKTGSAENPIPKLIPGRVAEQRFLDEVSGVSQLVPPIEIEDDRSVRHSLTDFTLVAPTGETLPINVKTASTPFRRAKDLVGLEPEDCIPIPAYKAFGASEAHPHLLYVISVDYELASKLETALDEILSDDDRAVWKLLGEYKGKWTRKAEDDFVNRVVDLHWDRFRELSTDSPFRVISAQRALAILKDNPKRTPGIGLRAWGTGANAEVNVHISVAEETRPLPELVDALAQDGIAKIRSEIAREAIRAVPDPAW